MSLKQKAKDKLSLAFNKFKNTQQILFQKFARDYHFLNFAGSLANGT